MFWKSPKLHLCPMWKFSTSTTATWRRSLWLSTLVTVFVLFLCCTVSTENIHTKTNMLCCYYNKRNGRSTGEWFSNVLLVFWGEFREELYAPLHATTSTTTSTATCQQQQQSTSWWWIIGVLQWSLKIRRRWWQCGGLSDSAPLFRGFTIPKLSYCT